MSAGRRDLAVAFAVLALCSSLLTWLAWGAVCDAGPVLWDFAVDMLLGNRIRDEGVLLVGHYSRFQFNHPGPFWFYYNALCEWLLSPSGLSRLQVWNLGQLVLASLLTSFTACALSLSLWGRVRFAASGLAVLVLCSFSAHALVGLWMPYRLIAPYGAFIACCVLISQGRRGYLPVGTLLACMLIHGYATMPLFTLPFLGLAFGLGYLAAKPAWRQMLLPLTLSFLIAAGFALPILWDALAGPASNFNKLLAAQRSFATTPRPSNGEVLGFVQALLPERHFIIWLLASVLLGAGLLLRRAQLVWAGWLFAAFLLLVAYYRTTPSPLYAFTAQFFTIVPILLLAICLVSACVPLQRPGGLRTHLRSAAAIVIGCGMAFLYLPGQRVPVAETAPYDEPALLADFIQADLKPGEVAAINYSDHDSWPFIAGLLLELDERGIAACTTWRHMAFLYTAREVCSAEQRPKYEIPPVAKCQEDCVVRGSSHALMRPVFRPVTAGVDYALSEGAAVFNGWYPPEADRRWSFGHEASIFFAPPTGAQLQRIRMRISSLGRQRVRLLLNGVVVYQAVLTGNSEELDLPLAKLAEGTQQLQFELPDAYAPGSDPRVMAVALHSLIFSAVPPPLPH